MKKLRSNRGMKAILRIPNEPGALVTALQAMDIQRLDGIESYPVGGDISHHNFNIEGDFTLSTGCVEVDEFPQISTK